MKVSSYMMRVLHKKIKYEKHRMRVLQELNVQNCTNEINFRKNITIYKALKYCLGILRKKIPHPPFHMEKERGAKV
jgi:hypothetical protein